MKKAFIGIIIFVLCGTLYSQTIQTRPSGMSFQQVGASNTWYQGNGVMYPVVGLVLSTYSDTTAANNALFTKNIAGCMIRVGDKIYFRSVALNSWIEIATGSLSTPTWQQTLTAGSTLTTNNSILTGATQLWFKSTYFPNGGMFFNGVTGLIRFGVVGPDHNQTYIDINDASGNITMGVGTSLTVLGLINSASQNRLLGQISSNGDVGNVTIGTGLSLSSGTLSTASGVARKAYAPLVITNDTI